MGEMGVVGIFSLSTGAKLGSMELGSLKSALDVTKNSRERLVVSVPLLALVCNRMALGPTRRRLRGACSAKRDCTSLAFVGDAKSPLCLNIFLVHKLCIVVTPILIISIIFLKSMCQI